MRILLIHNYYQLTGGEGLVFKAEAALLKAGGHTVLEYTAHNIDLSNMSSLAAATKMVWNREIYQDIHDLIAQNNIQIAHFHNTFPLISPAAYYAAKSAGAAVIQTLHNYRLLCPNALFFRDGKVCEDCLGKAIPWPGVVHQCYRDSLVSSSGVATMLMTHRTMKTWEKAVDTYIALTSFAKEKLVQGGLPADKIVIKPNFLNADPGYQPNPGQYALYVGRLSVEKGIDTLLSAWSELGTHLPLKIIGDGPLADDVIAAAQKNPNISWLGFRPMEEVYEHMKNALFLVFPSRWYEGLPRTIIESFAVGTPVVAADLGAMSSLIDANLSGWHFEAGNADRLIEVVNGLIANPELLAQIRSSTRKTFEDHYAATQNYKRIMAIYQAAEGLLTVA